MVLKQVKAVEYCFSDYLFNYFSLCSPVHPITNVVPLSLVLLVSLIKEAFEDWVSALTIRLPFNCFDSNVEFF